MSSANGSLVSVVIPVTSADTPVRVLMERYDAPLERAGYAHEFVFVLDGVGGSIESELRELMVAHPVKVVRLQGGGLGESIALSAGVERASGQLIINAPEYLQVEPDDIVKLVQALESGADFVSTWRWPRVDPLLNRLQSRLFNWCLRVAMGMPFHDLNSSLRGMRRRVLEEVSVYGELYRFLPVLAQRQGFRVVEVKVRHHEERGRRGFFGVGVYMRRLLDILAITFLTRFTQKPLRFFGMLGFLSMLVGLALCVSPLYQKFFAQASIQDKPIFVLGAVLVAFGIQLIGFGLVGEIIIFTQASNLRGYNIDDYVEHVPESPGPIDVTLTEGAKDVPLHVRELLPGEDARWDAFVRHHPQSTFFHLSGWRKVVEDTFHHEAHYLVAEQGRRWIGILPLFWVKSPFLGHNLVSLPYAVYGGALVEGEAGFDTLLEAAAAHGRRLGARYVELRHLEPRFGTRPTSALYVTFRKELPTAVEQVLEGMPKKARAEVRRARDKFQLRFEECPDLDLFFRLFTINKRRLGTPSLPLKWFQALREEFGRSVVQHLVRTAQGEPIATVLSFCVRETIYAYYSGSLDEHHGKGVNDFMYCKLMEWGVERGYRLFDFGRSRRDTGPASFKKHMGFTPQPLSYEYLLLQEDSAIPEFHPSNPRLQLPRRIWARLPGFLTSPLGARLSRYLP